MAQPGPGYVSVGEVFPNLFVGAKPPRGPILRQLGFTMLVLAADTNQPPDSEFPGIRVLRPRLLDDGSESPDHVAKRACPYARAVYAELRRGGKVLSTCEWGYNRSAIVAGLAMRMSGLTVDQVVARLRNGRPGHKGFIALGTPEYRRALTIGC
jgi:protein-tyrosine phosphatase